MTVTLNCQFCGRSYQTKDYHVPNSKYCSRRCLGLAHRTQITTNCKFCGKEFTHKSARVSTAKYCSIPCRTKAQAKMGSVLLRCKHCDEEFRCTPKSGKIYCSRACVNKSHHAIWLPTFGTVRKAMKVRGLIKNCEKCGYSEEPRILGVHHKDNNRKNNELENLVVLCPNCHSLEHLKHIPQGGTRAG